MFCNLHRKEFIIGPVLIPIPALIDLKRHHTTAGVFCDRRLMIINRPEGLPGHCIRKGCGGGWNIIPVIFPYSSMCSNRQGLRLWMSPGSHFPVRSVAIHPFGKWIQTRTRFAGNFLVSSTQRAIRDD
jgi:hypothetical protein